MPELGLSQPIIPPFHPSKAQEPPISPRWGIWPCFRRLPSAASPRSWAVQPPQQRTCPRRPSSPACPRAPRRDPPAYLRKGRAPESGRPGVEPSGLRPRGSEGRSQRYRRQGSPRASRTCFRSHLFSFISHIFCRNCMTGR